MPSCRAERGARRRASLRGFHTVVTGLRLRRGIARCRRSSRLTGEALASFVSTRNAAVGWDMYYLPHASSSSLTQSALPGERSP